MNGIRWQNQYQRIADVMQQLTERLQPDPHEGHEKTVDGRCAVCEERAAEAAHIDALVASAPRPEQWTQSQRDTLRRLWPGYPPPPSEPSIAELLARRLPPFTSDEARAVGHVASTLDARLAINDPVALGRAARIFRTALARKERARV